MISTVLDIAIRTRPKMTELSLYVTLRYAVIALLPMIGVVIGAWVVLIAIKRNKE